MMKSSFFTSLFFLSLISLSGCSGKLSFQDLTPNPLMNGMVGFWHLDETVSTVADSSSSANIGTIHGAVVTGGSGELDKAATFDGTGGYLSFTTSPTTSTGSFSIQAWIKTSTTGIRQQVVFYGSGTTNQGLYLFVNSSNQVEFDLSNRAGPHSAVTVTDGLWHHIAAVNNAGSVQIYLDGAASGTPLSMSPNIAVGGGDIGFVPASSWYFNGSIDEIAIWNTNLSASDITTLYNNQSAGTQISANSSSLVALWHLDEAAEGMTVEDSSGAGNAGVLVGAVTLGSAGKLNNAALLDGKTARIRIDSNLAITTATTFSAWVNPNTLFPGGGLGEIYYGKGINGISALYGGYHIEMAGAIGLTPGQINVRGSGPTQITSSYILPQSAWTHLVVTISDTTAKIYFNGVLDTTGSVDSLTANTGGAVYLGYAGPYYHNYYFSGLIDEVAIWSRALDASEVLQLYEATK